jgi:hypothetical protein
MKKFFGLVLVMAAFCVLVSCTSDSDTSSTGAAEVGPESNGGKVATKEYAVGDTGPAGGVIFYDDEADGTDDIPGVRYLEAAPADTSWEEIQWGEKGIDIPGADKTAIGTGMQNTEDLIRHQGADSEYAAAYCAGLVIGEYDDWYMPSKDELDLLVEDLYKNGFGDFEPYYHWSSSERSDVNAWGQHFFNSVQSSYPKRLPYRVRPVRAF